MKINEVEAQVGITKKNIRFYEEQGLIAPRRNSENGYREYGPREVDQLRQVKLLRKLGVPLEEIRKMQSGTHTVGDGMRRHLVTLERDKKNLEQSIQLCRTLSDRNERLDDLDAAALLEQMDRLEREGTTFLNKQVEDTKRLRYIAPAVVTVLTVALMAGLMALMIWGFTIDAEEAPPLPLVVVLVAIPGVIILGVLLALIQRVQEIEKGRWTMRKSTKGRGPVIVAALGTVVVALLFFGSLLWVMLEEEPIPAVIGIMVVYGLLAVAIVAGVLYAMVQRLREIQGGEEDEARKY